MPLELPTYTLRARHNVALTIYHTPKHIPSLSHISNLRLHAHQNPIPNPPPPPNLNVVGIVLGSCRTNSTLRLGGGGRGSYIDC